MALKEIPAVECDVLVIGGGLAGCWAALRAAELVPNVVLAEKGKVSRSGKSSFSGASILCPQEGEDLALWHKEIVQRGNYLNHQDWVALILQEQNSRIRDMIDWGISFEKDSKGRLVRSVGIAHGVTRVATVDSLDMMEKMKKQLLSRGVKLHERTMVLDLLTSDGLLPTSQRVCGAVGFNTQDGSQVVFNARAVVLASGSSGHLDLMGDGIAQAFRAGAEITGMEFTRLWDNQGFARKYQGVHLNTFQRLGMQLFNAQQERFMEHYQPELKERAKRQDLGLAIVTEGLEGRGPIYIDLTHISKEDWKKFRTLPTTADKIKALEEEGVDLSKSRVEYHVTSGFMTIQMGGVKHNIYTETSLPGLFVTGEAGGHPAHGTYSVGGVNLATCCVEGRRAGEYSALYAREISKAEIRKEQVHNILEEAWEPLHRKKGLEADELKEDIHHFLSPGEICIFKTKKIMKKVLAKIKSWKEDSYSLRAMDWHELVKANKLKNYIQCSELVFNACMVREETRASNIRLDFPYRDDVNWLKWIVLKNEGKNISTRLEPVPLYRYPVRPDKYEKVPYLLPLPGLRK